MRSRHCLAAIGSFAWVFLLHCGGTEPDGISNPPQTAAGAGDSGLRQNVELGGTYAGEILIEGNEWKTTSGGREVALLFSGRELKNVRQVELILEPVPASAFDLDSAAFAPEDPFITFGNGVEPLGGGRLRIGGASVSKTIEGYQQFGTFTVRTGGGFNSGTKARIEVSFLSLGPSSSDREEYHREELRFGVVVNE